MQSLCTFFYSLVISVGHPAVKHQARFHAARRRMCESDRTQWFDLQPLLLHLGNVILTCPSLSMSLAISHGHSKETHVLCSAGKHVRRFLWMAEVTWTLSQSLTQRILQIVKCLSWGSCGWGTECFVEDLGCIGASSLSLLCETSGVTPWRVVKWLERSWWYWWRQWLAFLWNYKE